MRILLLFLLFSIEIFAQTWPYSSSADNVSSAFGSRLYEGYDFHNGIDISGASGIGVTAITAGVVKDIGRLGYSDENVKVTDAYGNTIVYIHINNSVVVGQNISEGQILGTIKVDHLHLEARGTWDKNYTAYHPFYELPYSNSSNTISFTDNEIKSDADGSYIEIQVSSLQNDLDVCFVGINAEGFTSDGRFFNQFEIFKENWVDFEDKENCYDEPIYGQEALDNNGRLLNYNNEVKLQIVTQDFNGVSNQVLKFKFYIIED